MAAKKTVAKRPITRKKAVAKQPITTTPTVAKQITIRLTYNKKNGTVTSRPPSRFHEGDQVKFVSGRGDKVYVKLNPKAYQPSQFTPDSGPVKVIAAPTGGTSKAECGIIKANGEAWGWFPPGTESGVRATPLSKGIDTEP